MPGHANARFLELSHLTPDGFDGQEGVGGSMGEEEALGWSGGGAALEETFGFVDIAADADGPGEGPWVAEGHLDGHEAALGEPEEDGLVRWEALPLGVFKKFEEEPGATFDSRTGIAGEVVPRVAAEIVVWGVDQSVMEPREGQGIGQPSIAG